MSIELRERSVQVNDLFDFGVDLFPDVNLHAHFVKLVHFEVLNNDSDNKVQNDAMKGRIYKNDEKRKIKIPCVRRNAQSARSTGIYAGKY